MSLITLHDGTTIYEPDTNIPVNPDVVTSTILNNAINTALSPINTSINNINTAISGIVGGPTANIVLRGLQIHVADSTTINIYCDNEPLRVDPTGTALSVQIKTNRNGANGLDSGTIAANKWYYTYLIYNPTTNSQDSLLSLLLAHPTLPSGYTSYVRVGAVRTDGSANLKITNQYGKSAGYLSTITPLVVTAAYTTPTAIDVSNYISPTATKINGLIYNTQGGSCIVGSSSAGTANALFTNATVNTNQAIIPFSLFPETFAPTSIYFYTSSASNMSSLYITGWEDNL